MCLWDSLKGQAIDVIDWTESSDDVLAFLLFMTSVYADHEASMAWQAILHERGWAAPAWPVEWGGCDRTLTQHYIFSRESTMAGAPNLSPMGIRMVARSAGVRRGASGFG